MLAARLWTVSETMHSSSVACADDEINKHPQLFDKFELLKTTLFLET